MIYNTDTGQVEAYQDGSWSAVGGADTFIDLTDTPSSYIGRGGDVVLVKTAEDGIETQPWPVTGTILNFFLSDDAADIGSYYYMYPTESGDGYSELTSPSLSTGDDQLLWAFVTEAGEPGVEVLALGAYTATLFLKKTGNKDVRVYWKLFKRDTGGTETEILQSAVSDYLTSDSSQYLISAYLNEDQVLDPTDRLVLKLYANVSGTGTDVTVTLTMEGDYDSRLTINVLSSAFNLDRLSDVTISSPSNDEVLTYDSESGKWINQAKTGTFGGPFVSDIENLGPYACWGVPWVGKRPGEDRYIVLWFQYFPDSQTVSDDEDLVYAEYDAANRKWLVKNKKVFAKGSETTKQAHPVWAYFGGKYRIFYHQVSNGAIVEKTADAWEDFASMELSDNEPGLANNAAMEGHFAIVQKDADTWWLICSEAGQDKIGYLEWTSAGGWASTVTYVSDPGYYGSPTALKDSDGNILIYVTEDDNETIYLIKYDASTSSWSDPIDLNIEAPITSRATVVQRSDGCYVMIYESPYGVAIRESSDGENFTEAQVIFPRAYTPHFALFDGRDKGLLVAPDREAHEKTWDLYAAVVNLETLGKTLAANGIFIGDGGNIGIKTMEAKATLTFGDITSLIAPDTSEGSDNKRIVLAGSPSTLVSRGAMVLLMGSQYSGKEGDLNLYAGNPGVSGHGKIAFFTGGYIERMTLDSAGRLGLNQPGPGYTLDVSGDIHCTGKLTSDGGNDPPYVLYNYESRASIINRVKKEVLPDKLNGAVLFFNGDRGQLELFLPSKGEFRSLDGEVLETVEPIMQTFETEDRYYLDEETGEIKTYKVKRTRARYRLKPDHELDHKTGKIKRKIKEKKKDPKTGKEIEEEVGEEEVTPEEAIELVEEDGR